MAEGATLDSGDLAGVVLDRARPIDVPTIIVARAVAPSQGRAATATCTRSRGVRRLRIRTRDERPLPLQVDGDYIGEVDEAVFGVTPGGIAVVS